MAGPGRIDVDLQNVIRDITRDGNFLLPLVVRFQGVNNLVLASDQAESTRSSALFVRTKVQEDKALKGSATVAGSTFCGYDPCPDPDIDRTCTTVLSEQVSARIALATPLCTSQIDKDIALGVWLNGNMGVSLLTDWLLLPAVLAGEPITVWYEVEAWKIISWWPDDKVGGRARYDVQATYNLFTDDFDVSTDRSNESSEECRLEGVSGESVVCSFRVLGRGCCALPSGVLLSHSATDVNAHYYLCARAGANLPGIDPTPTSWWCGDNDVFDFEFVPSGACFYDSDCDVCESCEGVDWADPGSCQPFPAPLAPSGVSATDGTYCDKVQVRWNAVSGADYYKVYRNSNQIGGDISGTTFDDTSATAGSAHSYTVRAHNECGDSASSGSDIGYAKCGECVYTILPASSPTIPASGGGSQRFSVDTSMGCYWLPSTFDPWISIISFTNANGSGTVNYSVFRNTGISRSGTITVVPGKTHTVNQAACGTYSISPTSSPTIPPGGGPGSFSISTSSGCTWTAASNNSWITITSGSPGNGNGTVNYSVSENTGTSSRSGTITAAGKTYTVGQGVCVYSISPLSSSTILAGGGSGSFSVGASSGCTWSTSSNQSWITITSGSSGTGNGTVSYSVSSNTGTSSRSGTITAAGKTYTVSQAGPPVGTLHPADAEQPWENDCSGCTPSQCANGRIETCEVLKYVAAWKRGDHDDSSAVLRSVYLWKSGECYIWSASQQMFVPDSCD